MKHSAITFLTLFALLFVAAGASAATLVFEENTDNGSSEYEWEANNWYDSTGDQYLTPDSTDTGYIMSNKSCLIDGQSAVINTLSLGYDASGTGTLTINSGSLRVYGAGVAVLGVGKNSDGILNINGGTITVDSTDSHGGIRVGATYDGIVSMSGGTLTVDNVSLGYDGDATVAISGGEFNAAGRVMITHQGSKVTDSSITVSGDADVNLTGTGYNDGLNVYEGGTLRVVGSSATIDVAYNLWMGGWSDTDPNTTLSFQSDAGGVSTIYCDGLSVAAGSILDLSTDGNTSTGTYTLVSSTNQVTSSDLSNFSFSATTDTNEWSNLAVTGAGPYLVQVDYTLGAVTYALTVNSGTGDGSYAEDTVVNIDADAPGAGQAFDVWTGDTANIADTSDPNTTITMPAANATVTATYVNVYTLTVNDGTGDGDYEANTVVNIVAADPNVGDIFDVWTGDTANIANVNDANTTITMPAAAAEITATYTASGSGGANIIGLFAEGLSHTAETGSDRLLLFFAHAEPKNCETLNSVTYGGVSMTKLTDECFAGGWAAYVAVYYLDETGIANATGSTFVPTWSKSTNRTGYSSVFLEGVDQTTPIGASDTNGADNSSTITTGALATSSGDIVFVAGTSGDTGSWTVNNGFTEGLEVTVQNADGVAGYKDADGSNETPSLTHSQTGRQVIAGFVVQVSGDANSPPTYTLMVNSGTGDGSYEENDVVNIVADAPGAGQAFDVWTGDTSGIDNVNNADANITMPAANAAVTATYVAVDYTLTVNSGTGDGTYNYNDVVNIVADAPGVGQAFDVWTGDTAGIDNVNNADANITMPAANAAVTATYVAVDYTLTVNSGTGDGTYNYNDVVNIVADAPGVGQAFDVWTGDTAGIDNVNNADANITMPAANAAVTATYVAVDYTLTVNSGTGDGTYNYNDVVNIVADAPGVGQAFDVWTGDTTNVDNVNNADTNITMPAANAAVTATYVAVDYTLTVNDGTGDGNYTYNTVVNIYAADPNAGESFSVWTGDTANVADVNDPNTTITMPASSAEVTATYVVQTTETLTFQENTDNGSSEYEWEANNWYDSTGDQYLTPDSTDTGYIMSNKSCLIDGQSAVINTLSLGYNASGTGTLTIDFGSLRIYGTGAVTLTVGKNSGGTLNINGGTITVDSTYIHGGIRVGQTYDGTLNLSGGTLIVDNASFGYDADATVTISGGEFNAAGRVMITHQGTKVTDSSITISGDADVNLTGTGYSDGLNVYEGGTLRVVGSSATIDIAYNLWMGGWNDADPNTTLSFQSDAGGVSTINCDDLTVSSGSILDLSSNGSTPTGTYTLISCTNQVTQADVNNFTFSATTDTNEWSNLTVTGAGPYLVQVDHTGWQNADIGNPPTAGSADYTDGNWTVQGSGVIWGQADAFHFVYQPYTGDLEVIANVLNVNGTNSWAAGGVMIRQSLDANAKSAFMAVSAEAEGGLIYDYRTVANGSTSETGTAGAEPEWVKLRLEGNVIKGYYSSNGSSWTLVDTITFNMSANIYVGLGVTDNGAGSDLCTSTFQSLSVSPLYTLTVNSGTGDGMYPPNEVVNIYADPPGQNQLFDVWTGDTANIANVNDPNTTITMPASGAQVTATYVDANGLYTLTVNSGTGDGTYAENDVVNIVADPPGGGQIFDVWTGDTTNVEDVNLADTNITMPAATTDVTATYIADSNIPVTYTLTVNSGTGDGNYAESTVVNIVADAPGAGQVFDVWTGDTTNVADVNLADTNITMPAANAQVTATYADDPNTFQLTVNSGSGGGYYDANTVVNIVANNPPVGKLFDVWTGDTTNIADTDESNTNITMPSADSQVTATYADDPNYSPPGGGSRGYTARACGFDMDRNGIIGEPGDDDNVGDGVTTDPDGDGTDEDIIYVDANDGDDTTGDGSAGNPYKTIQKALDTADGPGDGAEDIIAIAGTFHEELTLTQSGVAGYYVRDSFQFPDNPTMLIGWDKDNDGEYPPYDTDDIAVLDGNVDGNLLPLAISNYDNKKSYIELAHLTVQNYGYRGAGDHGAIRFCGTMGTISHFYVHDVEFKAINKGIDYSGYVVVWSFWSGGTDFTYMGMINVLLDEFASFAVRGAPVGNSGHYRWQNLTMNFNVADNETATAWKLWGEHSDVEILDSIINGSPNDWTYGSTGTGPNGIAVCQCSQGWVIRNNEFHDLSLSVTMQGDAGPLACQSRPVDDIVIDRNIFRNTVEWQYRPRAIYIRGGALTTATTATVTVTNNFISSTTGWDSGIRCQAGNDEGTQPGSVTIVGNTIYGPFLTGWEGQGIAIEPSYTYKQQNFVIKNNIIANVGGGDNIGVTYAPSNFVANGNLYDDSGDYVWDGNDLATLAAWQTATGEDANSSEGDPNFIDDANGDFHLDPSDTIAEGAGVDISSIVDHDIDGDTRDGNTVTAGADVP